MNKISFKNKMKTLGLICVGIGTAIVVQSDTWLITLCGCLFFTLGYLLFLTYD